MKVAITGGLGFIGSHLVEELVRTGYWVRIIDSVDIDGHRCLPLVQNRQAEFCKADLCCPDSLEKCLAGIDGVFHLGGYSKIQDCLQYPDVAYQVNVGGTLNVLEVAEKMGVKRMVYAASASAYGDQKTLPFREDMPVQLLNPYAATKYLGEGLCRTFFGRGCLKTVSLRLFNVYGSLSAIKGQVPCPSVVERFLRQRRLSQPLTLIGDGSDTRDFVNVADVARAAVLAMTSSTVGRGEVVNIGSGQNYRISDIAKWINPVVISIPACYPEPNHTLADISLAKRILGWSPEIDLKNWVERQLAD